MSCSERSRDEQDMAAECVAIGEGNRALGSKRKSRNKKMAKDQIKTSRVVLLEGRDTAQEMSHHCAKVCVCQSQLHLGFKFA